MTFLYSSNKLRKNNLLFYIKSLVILIIITGLYVAYPYFTLWSISKAIQTHNTEYLAKSLNWHSIQDHLKTNLTQDFNNTTNTNDDLPEFGNSFAATAISNAIDHHINNTSLHILLNYISPPNLPDPSPLKNKQNALQIFMSSHIYFSSPLTLHAKIMLPYEKAPPLRITMKFQKWQWKITNINLPQEIITELFQHNDQEP